MGLIERLLLRQHNIDMSVALADKDLFNDLQANALILFDIVEPILQFVPVLWPDDLLQNLLRHHFKLYKIFTPINSTFNSSPYISIALLKIKVVVWNKKECLYIFVIKLITFTFVAYGKH